MLLPTVSAGRLRRVIAAGISSCSVLFSTKAINFGVPTLRRLIAIFVAFKILVKSGALDSSMNSSYFILPKELISVDNYISVYKGGKFHHQRRKLLAFSWLL